jgi:zinc-binding alcohol dehydrogenase family protein
MVVGKGADVRGFAPGDEVFYAGELERPGTNAELHAVDFALVGQKPRSLDFAAAAALPLTSITAWELLFDRLAVPRRGGEGASILVTGGAGGVGSILVQLARQLTALQVIATASRPDTVRWCHDRGAHHVVDHHQPLAEQIARLGAPPVRYVASLTGTVKNFPQLVEVLAPQGKIAVIDDPATLDIVPLKRKSASLHWEFMFARSLWRAEDMAEQGRLLSEVADLVDAGVLQTTVTRTLSPINAANLREAHRIAETGAAIGKTTLAGF